jgi:hypothetical protein
VWLQDSHLHAGAAATTLGPGRDGNLAPGQVTAACPPGSPRQLLKVIGCPVHAQVDPQGWRRHLGALRSSSTTNPSPPCRYPSETMNRARAGASPGPSGECVRSAPGPQGYLKMPLAYMDATGMLHPSLHSLVPRMPPARVPRHAPTRVAHARRRKLPEGWRWYLSASVCCVQVCEMGMAWECEDSPRAGEHGSLRALSPLPRLPAWPAPAPRPGTFPEHSLTVTDGV